MKLNTYNHGFVLNVPRYMSKGDVVKLCTDLEVSFGPGNEFRPEPIGNGFIIWSNWPGKDKEGYKCMRLFPVNNRYYNWPWLNPDVMDEWKDNPEPVITKGKYRTFLKSFRTAPKWTRDELRIFKRCLEELGTKPGAIPSQKVLDEV